MSTEGRRYGQLKYNSHFKKIKQIKKSFLIIFGSDIILIMIYKSLITVRQEGPWHLQTYPSILQKLNAIWIFHTECRYTALESTNDNWVFSQEPTMFPSESGQSPKLRST